MADYLEDFKFFMECKNAEPETADESDKLFKSRYERLLQIIIEQGENIGSDDVKKLLKGCEECAYQRLGEIKRRKK